MREWLTEFRAFMLRGNLVDTAVGIVIGLAFTAVITALVASLITPLIAAIFGKPDFAALTFTINGSVFTLLALTLPFILAFLGLGLYISTQVSTREAAGQMAMGTMMPSIFLSGYVFPLDSMPTFFWYAAQIFPTTWLIDAARGVILRGAGWSELWMHAVVLWAMGIATFALSMLKFRKRLG